MRSYPAGLLTSVTGAYDKTKTTIQGRVFQKVISGQSVVGPPLTSFVDTQTVAALSPSLTYFNPNTNRLFVISTATSSPTVVLYTFNAATGAYAFVGKIVMTLANAAATTHVFRGLKVDDSNTANIKIFLSTTASVLINGGTYMGYGIALADFTPGGTTIWAPIANGAKGCYFLQDSTAMGVAHVATSSWGCALPFMSANGGVNTKVYQINGTLALPVVYAWDYSATPQVSGISTGISSQTTLWAGTAPSAYFNAGASVMGVFSTNDPVVLTGTVPANFTASTGNGTQTVYFIRDVQQVVGVWYFNLALTSGGAAVVPTSNTAGFALARAFGACMNLLSFKTGTLAPALTGALIQSNSFDYCVPTSAPLNAALNGVDCLYVATSTTLYLFKLSDLSSGATSWPSLTGANILGSGIDIVAPTVAQAVYSTELDRFVYITNTSTFVVKPLQNNFISAVFGGLSNAYLEVVNPVTVMPALAALAGLTVLGGWMFITGSTAGQRGVIACDLRSDHAYGYSGVITPVLNVPATTIFKHISANEALYGFTDTMVLSIRSAATATDAVFNSATGGWVTISEASDLSAVAIGPYFQIMLQFNVQTLLAGTPAQVSEIIYDVLFAGEMSDNWALDVDSTTVGTNTPSYVAFVLTKLYQALPATLFVRGYDTSGNLISAVNDTTAASPGNFQYSTDGGVTWNAFSMAALTAVGVKLRYNVTTPPGVETIVSLREF